MRRWSLGSSLFWLLVLVGCGGSVEPASEALGAAGAAGSHAQGGQAGAGPAGAAGASDSSGAAPACSLAAPQKFAQAQGPWAIQADDDTVFWVDEYEDYTCGIHAKAKQGGEIVQLAVFEERPSDLAVDATHVYVAVGAKLVMLAKNGGGWTELAQEATSVRSVAVDATHVYFTDGGGGRVMSVMKGSGAISVLADGFDSPGNLALDDEAVYGIDESQQPAQARVFRLAKGGGPVTVLAEGVSVALQGHGRSTQSGLAVGSGWAVWVDEDGGAVHKVPSSGGASTEMMTGLLRPTAVVLYGGLAYVAVSGGDNHDGRAVVKLPLGGGPPQYVVKDNQFVPYDLVVDSLHVHWTNPFTTGPVMRACR
jgi:hypothetical protein